MVFLLKITRKKEIPIRSQIIFQNKFFYWKYYFTRTWSKYIWKNQSLSITLKALRAFFCIRLKNTRPSITAFSATVYCAFSFIIWGIYFIFFYRQILSAFLLDFFPIRRFLPDILIFKPVVWNRDISCTHARSLVWWLKNLKMSVQTHWQMTFFSLNDIISRIAFIPNGTAPKIGSPRIR